MKVVDCRSTVDTRSLLARELEHVYLYYSDPTYLVLPKDSTLYVIRSYIDSLHEALAYGTQ